MQRKFLITFLIILSVLIVFYIFYFSFNSSKNKNGTFVENTIEGAEYGNLY